MLFASVAQRQGLGWHGSPTPILIPISSGVKSQACWQPYVTLKDAFVTAEYKLQTAVSANKVQHGLYPLLFGLKPTAEQWVVAIAPGQSTL